MNKQFYLIIGIVYFIIHPVLMYYADIPWSNSFVLYMGLVPLVINGIIFLAKTKKEMQQNE